MRMFKGLLVAGVTIVAAMQSVGAQQPPPRPPDARPERDPIPGPYIVFFDDAGQPLRPDDNDVLQRAVAQWQSEPYEGFLLCVRRRDGAPAYPRPRVDTVAKRLHAQGAKLVVGDVVRPCQGPMVNASQHKFDSVEVLSIHAL